MSLIQKISGNVIARNLVLAFCAIAVFVGLCALALNIFTRHNQQKPVPDFIGVHLSDVEAQARKAGLRLEVVDSIYAPIYAGGTVVEQTPAGGTEVKKGRRIFITITSHQQKMVTVPFVTGFSLRQANNIIEMAGLEIKELRYVPNLATGNVLAELAGRDTVRYGSDFQLEVGSGLTLVVGQAEDVGPVSIPKVVGLTFGEAKSRLWEYGFNIGEVSMDDDINLVNQKDARVYRQVPSYSRRYGLGTRVALGVTLDEAKVADGAAAADWEARQIIQAQMEEEAAMARDTVQ